MATLDFTANFASASSNLTLVAPTYDVWDFDHSAISTWDTDVTVSTETDLETAITTAMGLGTTANPQYHRITWTGGAINNRMTLTSAAAVPDKYGPHILIDGGGYTEVNDELSIYSISNVKFIGFQFQSPSDWAFKSSALNMVRFYGDGGGRRVSFAENRFGVGWNGGTRNEFSRAFGTGSDTYDWDVSVKNNEARGLFEFIEWSVGKIDVQQNLVRDLVDDFMFCAARSHGGVAYAYVVGNVVCDMHDDFNDWTTHPDFIQCADNSDGAADEYEIIAQGNIYIGDTHTHYPTMWSIIQKQGGANRFAFTCVDNICLTTGDRGHYQPDQEFVVDRNLYGLPPLDQPIAWDRAASGATQGWQSSNPSDGTPIIKSSGNLGDSANTNIGTYIAARAADNVTGWLSLPDPTIIADPQAALGTPTAYDIVFPNMTSLTWQGSPYNASAMTLMIDNGWSSLARTKEAIRDWVSNTYEPNTVANGTGWAANGFNDPAGWF